MQLAYHTSYFSVTLFLWNKLIIWNLFLLKFSYYLKYIYLNKNVKNYKQKKGQLPKSSCPSCDASNNLSFKDKITSEHAPIHINQPKIIRNSLSDTSTDDYMKSYSDDTNYLILIQHSFLKRKRRKLNECISI